MGWRDAASDGLRRVPAATEWRLASPDRRAPATRSSVAQPCRRPRRRRVPRDACGLPGRLSIALGRRLRALRQRPGAMAHLHGGRMICTRARHEAGRHQQAARQGGQQQQRDPEVGPAASCPADVHETSLDQGARSATFGYPQFTAVLSRRRETCVPMRRARYRPWRTRGMLRDSPCTRRGVRRVVRTLRRTCRRTARRSWRGTGCSQVLYWRNRPRRPWPRRRTTCSSRRADKPPWCPFRRLDGRYSVRGTHGRRAGTPRSNR